MKRFFGAALFLFLLTGSFFLQTPKASAAPTGLFGGTVNRVIWESSNTLGFSVSDITTGLGTIDIWGGGRIIAATRFSANSSGNAVVELFVNGCDNLGVQVFDGEAGSNVMALPSCSTFTPAPFGPDTCIDGYVWRQAYGSSDHVCVTRDHWQQAVNDNSQAPFRVDPNGAFGPDTCIAGYVWREASKGIDPSITDHVCVTLSPDIRQQTADDNAQAPFRKLFP